MKIAKRLRNRNKEQLVKPQKVQTILNFQSFLIKNNECKVPLFSLVLNRSNWYLKYSSILGGTLGNSATLIVFYKDCLKILNSQYLLRFN